MSDFLVIDDLRAGYGAAQVLHGVSLSVGRGEVCAILGPNGAGKTTLLRTVSGMVRARAGSVRIDGEPLGRRNPESVARLGVAHVPQGRGTFAPLSVADNLRLGAFTRRDNAAVRADLERVFGYFPILKDKLHQQAGGLSGGQQQMLALGRALMMRPRLLLLDEPSLGLSPLVTQELFAIIATVNRTERTTVVVVEQNAHLALAMADRAHVLETGRVVLSGTPADINADEQIARSYLGYQV
ncbi:ABC transporter ATP-binding protein [Nocardia arizonensis]|uniref:ABC transporter ATP-binding protein n=1 Tax=Nocardia arizonensis TaxID=1141647 RepID=UPI0006D19D11|nr:ABC transporter ATP-binding protein [Nocardia arizonensis]